jgi:pimeloyl-ACP methyl ester carboxylesterase
MTTPETHVADGKSAKKQRGKWYWRWLKRVAVFLAVLYLGLGAVLYFLQAKLMFPGAASQGQANAIVEPAKDCRLVTMKTQHGETVTALFGPALGPGGKAIPDAAERPTLLFFYGNGMCLADSFADFMEFRQMGLNVMIPDYVGYGMSTGAVGEQGCYDTADVCWDYLHQQKDVDPKKIILGGWSLGTAVAIDLASRHPGEVTRLMGFSGFTSGPDVGASFYPFLPVRLLRARKRFQMWTARFYWATERSIRWCRRKCADASRQRRGRRTRT